MKTFCVGDRVAVTDSSTHKVEAGTVVRVWPNYSSNPEEKGCYDIRLDAPWSGSQGEPVMQIGRTERTMEAIA